MAATPGIPPIRHVAVLTDRRHVLTQDSEGKVLLWDVTAGALRLWAGSSVLLACSWVHELVQSAAVPFLILCPPLCCAS